MLDRRTSIIGTYLLLFLLLSASCTQSSPQQTTGPVKPTAAPSRTSISSPTVTAKPSPTSVPKSGTATLHCAGGVTRSGTT